MGNLVLKQTCLSEMEALAILKEFDQYFQPCLSSRLNIEEFAGKLSQNAEWILCNDNNSIVGYIAYYSNNDMGMYYMTSYCEAPSNHKYLEKMITQLIDNAPAAIKEIRFRCRKDNRYDIDFYKQYGFESTEDLGDNIILKKDLLNN